MQQTNYFFPEPGADGSMSTASIKTKFLEEWDDQVVQVRTKQISGPWAVFDLDERPDNFMWLEDGENEERVKVKMPAGCYSDVADIAGALQDALRNACPREPHRFGLSYFVRAVDQRLVVKCRVPFRLSPADDRKRSLYRLLGFPDGETPKTEEVVGIFPVDLRHSAVFVLCDAFLPLGGGRPAIALHGLKAAESAFVLEVMQAPRRGERVSWASSSVEWRTARVRPGDSVTFSIVDVDGQPIRLNGLRNWVFALDVRAASSPP